MPMNRNLRATGVAHLVLDGFIGEGQTAIDATAGNGYDTLYLARKVGKLGRVYAFDIQAQALAQTKMLLEEAGCLRQVRLIQDSHENMDTYVKEPAAAIVYNLGYLPGGNKTMVTTPDTTVNSLEKALELLAPGGLISIVAYPGHPGGAEELRRVEEILVNLTCPPWHVLKYTRLNSNSTAPCLLVCHRGESYEEETS